MATKKITIKTRFSQLGGSFDKILSNIQLAINNEIEVIARFNYTKDNLWGIYSALERLATFTNKDKITIALNQVWQDGDIKRTPYEKRKIEKELKRIRKGIVE
jgi:putative transcriptional regulator